MSKFHPQELKITQNFFNFHSFSSQFTFSLDKYWFTLYKRGKSEERRKLSSTKWSSSLFQTLRVRNFQGELHFGESIFSLVNFSESWWNIFFIYRRNGENFRHSLLPLGISMDKKLSRNIQFPMRNLRVYWAIIQFIEWQKDIWWEKNIKTFPFLLLLWLEGAKIVNQSYSFGWPFQS